MDAKFVKKAGSKDGCQGCCHTYLVHVSKEISTVQVVFFFKGYTPENDLGT